MCEDSGADFSRKPRPEFFQQNFHDSFRRMSIPKLGSLHCRLYRSHQPCRNCKNFLRIPSYNLIRPLFHRHGPFRILPKSQARNTQNGALS